MKSLVAKLTNTKTVLALTGLAVSLVVQFGFNIDDKAVLGIIDTACTMLAILGIMNNSGMNNLKWNK